MVFASKESLNKLRKLENEFFELDGRSNVKETQRCMFEGELVKGFVKSQEMVNEAIERLEIKIEILKEEISKKEEQQVTKKKLPAGIIEAKYEGYDCDTGEKIHIGDWIVKTSFGYSHIHNAF